jgi:hypothetical protein
MPGVFSIYGASKPTDTGNGNANRPRAGRSTLRDLGSRGLT